LIYLIEKFNINWNVIIEEAVNQTRLESYLFPVYLYDFLEELKEDFKAEIPKEVLETGEVVFNTDLKKMKIIPEHAEKLFNKAIKLLNSDCPKESCDWCEGR